MNPGISVEDSAVLLAIEIATLFENFMYVTFGFLIFDIVFSGFIRYYSYTHIVTRRNARFVKWAFTKKWDGYIGLLILGIGFFILQWKMRTPEYFDYVRTAVGG